MYLKMFNQGRDVYHLQKYRKAAHSHSRRIMTITTEYYKFQK